MPSEQADVYKRQTQDIEAAKALHPDVLIACMHWGIEYQSLPNKEQTSLADWLLDVYKRQPCNNMNA